MVPEMSSIAFYLFFWMFVGIVGLVQAHALDAPIIFCPDSMAKMIECNSF